MLNADSEQKNLIQDTQRPSVPKGTHPIETGRYLLATNEIDRMYELVSQWIDNRSPGGIVHGRPRLGKSRAINYLMHTLPEDFGERLPMFLMTCRQYKNSNESIFFEDLLRDSGHPLSASGKANVKRDRLLKYYLERAESSGLNRIILFIDDAQRLAEIQYGWLMDIYNELDRAGVSMTVILVGQDELIHQRSAFIQSKKAQIVGRFMIHTHQFTGVKLLDDLRACLYGYDEGAQYPVSSGWSFTRYFFPESFDRGFRLDRCAEDLFDVFTDLRREAGLKGPIEIPMQYLTLSIDNALRKYGVNGEDAEWLTKAQWKDCVQKSGYIDAEVYQSIL